MNPIPPMRIPPEALPVGVYADPILLIAVAAIAFVFALMVWSAWSGRERRERRICPEQLRAAKIRVALDPIGRPVDVVRCSLLDRGPLTCSKACIAVRPV
jgi:hypothetical protein